MFRIIEDNFDEILFEKRQKKYGAFFLRKNYHKYVNIGAAITFSIFISFIFGWYFVENTIKPKEQPNVDQDLFFESFDSSLPPLPLDKITPRLTKAGTPKPTEDEVPKVVKDELVKDKIKSDETNKTEIETLIDTSSKTGTDEKGKDALNSKGVSNKGDSTSLIKVDPIGGISEFVLYVQKNVQYPEEAKRNNISGTIYVYFIVNEEGKIEDIKITKPLGFGINEEVMRVIRAAPSWKPMLMNGIAQKQRIHVPIKLNLPK